MWKYVSLRARVYAILSTLVVVTIMGCMIIVWFTFRMEALLISITEKNLQTFQTAESLETALVNQKGFVSYYFLDGDPEWLRQLGEYRQIFKERMNAARHLADTDIEIATIDRIEHEYGKYKSMIEWVYNRLILNYEAIKNSKTGYKP